MAKESVVGSHAPLLWLGCAPLLRHWGHKTQGTVV
jgi:hypothetical protein